MGRNSILLIFYGVVIISLPLTAQPYTFQPHRFGTNLFAGGIDTPRYQFVDIDNDGDADLFLLDRDERVWFYRNDNGVFRLEPDQLFGLTIGSWFRFVDIDNDGDLDCFTNGEFSDVIQFTNIGTSTAPQFQKINGPLLDTSAAQLFSERFSIPTFADIDGDGDEDFFTGSQIGSVTYYENVGTSTVPAFAFVTSEFNGIKIVGGGLRKVLHGASGIEFFDADSNGTLDLFWGDYFNPSMYALKNIGTKFSPNMVLTDSTYPKGSPVVTFGFNIPQHVDIDRDGRVDLMVGSVFPTEGLNNLWYLKNIGSNSSPQYAIESKNFISMIDVGGRSSVAFGDFDGDGDLDMCISSGGGEITIYWNAGSPTNPVFSGKSTIYESPGSFFMTVTSGDVDHDGKPDLLVGDFSGRVRFLKNESSAANVVFQQYPFPLDSIDVGNSASPCIGDIDQDGVWDVLIGNSAGTLTYYKNIGTSSAPIFSLVSNFFGGIDVGNDASPFVIDLDGNGRNDIIIGNSTGEISRYEFNPVSLDYGLVTSAFAGINANVNIFPAAVDLDGDGDLDLFLGNGKGGVYYYENTSVAAIRTSHRFLPEVLVMYPCYPNPFNPMTTISFHLGLDAMVDIKIYSAIGKEVADLWDAVLPSGYHSVSWDATSFSSGTYFCRISVLSKNQKPAVQTRPMVYIK